MTPNLHLLLCQLLKQCAEHGQTVGCNELWVERLIQKFKDAVHNRCTKDPEPVLTDHLILESAIRLHKPSSVSDPSLQSCPVPIKSQNVLHKHSEMLGKGHDVGEGPLSCACLEAVSQHLQKLRNVVKNAPAELCGWSDDLNHITITSYSQMEWHGSTVATSSYLRKERRNDSYVSVPYADPVSKQPFIRVGRFKISFLSGVNTAIKLSNKYTMHAATLLLLSFLKPCNLFAIMTLVYYTVGRSLKALQIGRSKL